MQKLRLFSLLCVLIHANQSLAVWTREPGSNSHVFVNNVAAAHIQRLEITSGTGPALLQVSFQNSFFRVLFQQYLEMQAPVTNVAQISVWLTGEVLSAALMWIRLRDPELGLLLQDVL